MTGIEELFTAAVNIIQSLPKNGPYQPSVGLKLKFYGLFKQATEGNCTQKKPAFWDLVGMAKWKSWNKRSHLSKEEAMQQYVDAFRELIVNMPTTENVADMTKNLSGLEKLNLDDLELLVPGVRNLAETHPDSPFRTRIQNVDFEAQQPVNIHRSNSSVGTIETSDDEYADPMDFQNETKTQLTQNIQMIKQIEATIRRMNLDIATLKMSVQHMRLELQVLSKLGDFNGNTATTERKVPAWWPFENISPFWFVILMLWPFVAKRFSTIFVNANSKRN